MKTLFLLFAIFGIFQIFFENADANAALLARKPFARNIDGGQTYDGIDTLKGLKDWKVVNNKGKMVSLFSLGDVGKYFKGSYRVHDFRK